MEHSTTWTYQSVQSSRSVVSNSLRPHGVRQASLSITNSWSLLKLMSIESVMPSNHLILCCPLLLLPSIFPSTRVFSNESVIHIRWPFRIDWLDLLALWGTLKSLLLHHSSKASILQHSAFFMVLLPYPYITTGKTALTRRTFVGKVMSLLFNMLSRLVIAFFPRSKHLLISWLQSPSAVILEPKKRKSVTVSGSGLFSLPAKKLAIFSRMAAPFYISPSSSVVKNPPAMEETPVQSLGREDPLEEG